MAQRLTVASRMIVAIMGMMLTSVTPGVRVATASPITAAPSVPGPWLASQLLAPKALVKEIGASQARKPVIVCVGFHFFYEGAHVLGALYEGPAREPSGLAKLIKWAKSIPKDTPVVIYCGCCPFSECPNIRPAFSALRRAGLIHLRVLYLKDNFARDWVTRGYPAQRNLVDDRRAP